MEGQEGQSLFNHSKTRPVRFSNAYCSHGSVANNPCFYLSDGVSWGWSIVTGCWWDDWASWGWDGWGSNWNSGLAASWLSGNVGESGLLFEGLASNDVLGSGHDLLGSNLNGAGSDNSVVNNSLSYSWSGMDGLLDGGEGGSNTGIADGKGCLGCSQVVGWC